MPRKGRNIYLRKDGRWEGRYSQEKNGKLGYVSLYGKTYSEVKEKLKKCEFKTKEEDLAIKKEPFMYFADLMVLYLEVQKSIVKESTYVRYQALVKKHINPFFESYRLGELTPALINNFISLKLSDEKVNEKGGLAPKTVRDLGTFLRSVIIFGEKEGLIQNISDEFILPKVAPYQAKTLSKEELSLLISKLLTKGSLRDYGILIALFTGLRIGELCALKWEDISLKTDKITINKTIQRISVSNEDLIEGKPKTKVIITSPKSRSSNRSIPIPEFLKNRLLKIQPLYSKHSYFLSGKESKSIEPRTFQYYFKNQLQDFGISEINFHGLRHTFATQCVEIDFDIKALSEILGHSSVSITLNRYVHPSFESKQRQVEQLVTSLI